MHTIEYLVHNRHSLAEQYICRWPIISDQIWLLYFIYILCMKKESVMTFVLYLTLESQHSQTYTGLKFFTIHWFCWNFCGSTQIERQTSTVCDRDNWTGKQTHGGKTSASASAHHNTEPAGNPHSLYKQLSLAEKHNAARSTGKGSDGNG